MQSQNNQSEFEVLQQQAEEMRNLIKAQATFIGEFVHVAGRQARREMRDLTTQAAKLTGDDSLIIPWEDD